MKKIGFIGMGNMAKAMAIGFVRSGKVAAEEMGAYAPNQEKLAKNAEEVGFKPYENIESLINDHEVIVMACKPYQIENVLAQQTSCGVVRDLLAGKVLLSVFRVALFGGLCWWINKLAKNPKTPMGALVGLTLITAGALGNIIDCFFYGLIWPETITPGAPFAVMFGQVVDMFYFPLFEYKLPWMEYPRMFFGAVFNFADSCVTCGAIYLLLFQYKFFAKEENLQ